MPHALTDRQREYLEFIRTFIQENESAPRLDQIANQFGVTSPTAHKMLDALHQKGYLYFARDSRSGFYIRLIERAGTAELVTEVMIAGKVDKHGEVLEFPEHHGHFASVLQGANPENIFALYVTEAITQANMMVGDLLIFDHDKWPQPGDICIILFGDRLFLVQMYSKTFDKDTPSFEMSNQYPIPERWVNKALGQKLNWAPLAYDDGTADYFFDVAEKEDVPIAPIPPDLVLATALRLSRLLTM